MPSAARVAAAGDVAVSLVMVRRESEKLGKEKLGKEKLGKERRAEEALGKRSVCDGVGRAGTGLLVGDHHLRPGEHSGRSVCCRTPETQGDEDGG